MATKGLARDDVAALQRTLTATTESNPDFWSVIGLTELRIAEAIAGGKLAIAIDGIVRDVEDVKRRAGSVKMWRSVEDQARFTLWSYLRSATPTEAAAVERLLQAFGIDKPAPDQRPKRTRPASGAADRGGAARAAARAAAQPHTNARKRAGASRRGANGAKQRKA
jgi:hypothetical protein